LNSAVPPRCNAISAGGERAAAIYSLLGSAKLNGLDPEIYLHHILERIVDHPINKIRELLRKHSKRLVFPSGGMANIVQCLS